MFWLFFVLVLVLSAAVLVLVIEGPRMPGLQCGGQPGFHRHPVNVESIGVEQDSRHRSHPSITSTNTAASG